MVRIILSRSSATFSTVAGSSLAAWISSRSSSAKAKNRRLLLSMTSSGVSPLQHQTGRLQVCSPQTKRHAADTQYLIAFPVEAEQRALRRRGRVSGCAIRVTSFGPEASSAPLDSAPMINTREPGSTSCCANGLRTDTSCRLVCPRGTRGWIASLIVLVAQGASQGGRRSAEGPWGAVDRTVASEAPSSCFKPMTTLATASAHEPDPPEQGPQSFRVHGRPGLRTAVLSDRRWTKAGQILPERAETREASPALDLRDQLQELRSGQLHASRLTDLNRWPSLYKSAALPLS